MVPYRGMEVPYRECGPTGRVQGEAAHAPGIELFSGSCDLGLVTSLDHDEVGLYGLSLDSLPVGTLWLYGMWDLNRGLPREVSEKEK